MSQDIVSFLHDSTKQFGDKPALFMKPGIRYLSWSYAQMWEEAGKVASFLQQKGIKKGDRVAIWAPNSPQWVFAFFGSMGAGAIPVPVDLRSDEGFVARISEKARPSFGFSSRFAANLRGADRISTNSPSRRNALSTPAATGWPGIIWPTSRCPRRRPWFSRRLSLKP